jgi:Holliday junction DNA helicase RuvA
VIGRLCGTLADKGPQHVLLDVAGVGYRVQVPLSTFYKLGELGTSVTLLVHTHVRDDALQLFGFLTPEEQTLFERLIAVAGVGPRLAVNVLSGIDSGELIDALRGGDVARLTRIPGIGKKTAERLVLELKEAMEKLASAAGATAPARDTRCEDLLAALLNLGYSRPEAERAAQQVARDNPAAALEDLLRASLRGLSSR